MGPQHNKTMAAAALAEWNPNARRVINRILLFNLIWSLAEIMWPDLQPA